MLHKAMSEHFDQVHEEDLSKLGCDIIIRDRKEYCEIRFYLSRLPIIIKKFARAVRAHWGIENSVHWVLDMTFNENQWRIRKGHSLDNFASVYYAYISPLHCNLYTLPSVYFAFISQIIYSP